MDVERSRVEGRVEPDGDPGYQLEVPLRRTEEPGGVRGGLQGLTGGRHEPVLPGSGPSGEDTVLVGPVTVGAVRTEGEGEFGEFSRKAAGKNGAVIVVPPRGDPAFAFNSPQVSLAMRTGNGERTESELVVIAGAEGS